MLPSRPTRKLHLKLVENKKKLVGRAFHALADQEMAPWWSIDSSLMSPKSALRNSPKQQIPMLILEGQLVVLYKCVYVGLYVGI